jgi:hypothetical protein
VSPIPLVILVALLLGALPTWPYSCSWGYYPSGGLGLVVVVLLVLLLAGRVGEKLLGIRTSVHKTINATQTVGFL